MISSRLQMLLENTEFSDYTEVAFTPIWDSIKPYITGNLSRLVDVAYAHEDADDKLRIYLKPTNVKQDVNQVRSIRELDFNPIGTVHVIMKYAKPGTSASIYVSDRDKIERSTVKVVLDKPMTVDVIRKSVMDKIITLGKNLKIM